MVDVATADVTAFESRTAAARQIAEPWIRATMIEWCGRHEHIDGMPSMARAMLQVLGHYLAEEAILHQIDVQEIWQLASTSLLRGMAEASNCEGGHA